MVARTDTHTAAEPVPVPVAITNAGDLAGMMTRKGPRAHVRSVYRTYVLTAANPFILILGEDLSRRDTWVIAYGNSVVLCESQSQAQDPANAVAGAGAFANTPANPQGTLLFVPSGAFFTGTPSPVSARWTLNTTEPVWAAALAFPAMLAVTTRNHADGY